MRLLHGDVLTRSVLVVLPLAMVLFACGSGDDDDTGASSETGVAAEETEANRTGTEAGVTEVDTTRREPPATGGGESSVGVTPLRARPVGEASDFGNGLQATVIRVDMVDVEGIGPHETSGPGVSLVLKLTNSSDSPMDLISSAVTVTGRDGEIGIPVRSGWDAHEGVLEPGASQVGTYAFRLDGDRSGLSIDVYHASSENIVVVHS